MTILMGKAGCTWSSPPISRATCDSLYSGEANVTWIDEEAHRLLNLVESKAGVVLPDGGAVVDNLYGHYPDIGWRSLIKEFFLKHLITKDLAEGSIKDLWKDVYNTG